MFLKDKHLQGDNLDLLKTTREICRDAKDRRERGRGHAGASARETRRSKNTAEEKGYNTARRTYVEGIRVTSTSTWYVYTFRFYRKKIRSFPWRLEQFYERHVCFWHVTSGVGRVLSSGLMINPVIKLINNLPAGYWFVRWPVKLIPVWCWKFQSLIITYLDDLIISSR